MGKLGTMLGRASAPRNFKIPSNCGVVSIVGEVNGEHALVKYTVKKIKILLRQLLYDGWCHFCITKTTCYAGGSKKLLAMSRKNNLLC
jgi:hypothetical protein